MPYSLADAPPNITDAELIESLLCERIKRKQARPLQELTEAEKAQTNLVELGKRQTHIDGDPYGVWCAWAGNVCHQEDDRMVDVLGPILDAITADTTQDTEDVAKLSLLLDRIPSTDICLLAHELAEDDPLIVDRSDLTQVTATFRYASRSVRLVQCLDLNVEDKQTYNASAQAKRSAKLAEDHVGEGDMPVAVQQYLMARILAQGQDGFRAAIENETSTMSKTGGHTKTPTMATLRSLAREQYWLDMSTAERAGAREAASSQDRNSKLEASHTVVEANWNGKWDNGHWDPDYFRNYLIDQTAAEKVWTLVDEDIFIVTDKNRRVVFANIERLSQILFGEEVTQLMDRAIDLWSFYHPLPRPETSRHVVDRYVRRKHPELDPSKCTVETLQNAKMAVAHYGCWSLKGDPRGKFICQTADTRGVKTHNPELFGIMFQRFAKAVLGKTSELIRFLAKPLDEKYYKECVEIFENLPDMSRLSVDREEDWISLFALGINGYTQRHTDIRDIQGGLAGLFTVGRYTGANLCLPQLGVKVPYASGACAILRGSGLEHLVQDYSGPRFFVIGTNHDACRRHAMRKLGRLPALPDAPPRTYKGLRAGPPPDSQAHGEAVLEEDDEDEPLEAPCVNVGADEEGDVEWTNNRLHGPAVLPAWSFVRRGSDESTIDSRHRPTTSGSESE